jgi:putative endopeptidase
MQPLLVTVQRYLIASLVALLAACPAAPPRRAARAEEPPPAATRAAAPAAKSGLDLAGFDRALRPQDDLFNFANGHWLASTEIPPDRSSYGMFVLLKDNAERQVRQIVEQIAATSDHPSGSDAQKLGDFYRSFTDTATLERQGIKPLEGELARIRALRTAGDVAAYIGYANRIGIRVPISYDIAQDEHDTTRYIGRVTQSGLTMPDRDYYLSAQQKYPQFRAAFSEYVEQLLLLAGERDTATAARGITALEVRIAASQWSLMQNRDPVAQYNKLSGAQLQRLAPSFPWTRFFGALGAPAAAVIVAQPSYVSGLAKLVRETPVAQWRAYFTFHALDSYAPYLARQFDALQFDFHEHTLLGTPQQRPRWQRALQVMDKEIGQLIGKVYVERHFTPEAKRRIVELIAHLVAAFDQSIDELEWMGPETRAAARQKLAKFSAKVGYPDVWLDYAGLEIAAGDLVGNVRRAEEFEYLRELKRIDDPVDRSEWAITPQTVNAYYRAWLNDITFPAAILQPPFFDADADDAVNYGAIGAAIGHEISHGFDDSGRHYDGDGNLREWWTAQDAARFQQRAGALAAQYSAYRVLDGQPVDGNLTLGENIGDLSGVTIAYRAYLIALGGRPAPVLDGFTGPQRFFLGWAQLWRAKYRDDALRARLASDVHSPPVFRVNGVLCNFEPFYQAFGVQQRDKMYRTSADRVKIW